MKNTTTFCLIASAFLATLAINCVAHAVQPAATILRVGKDEI